MAIAVAVLPLAACGDEAVERTANAPERPTGADEVVVQVMVDGGFVPVEMAVAAVPTVTVLGDGTVITQAPVPAIYPGPAIVPLQAATAGAKAVDELVRRAGELGLLAGPLEFGRPPVADAPDTTVTVVAGGRTYTHTANALGIGSGLGPGDTNGLTGRERANREALSAFVAATGLLPPGDRAWRPQAVAVYVIGDYRPEPGLPQRPATWPVVAPAVAGGSFPCTLYQGADVDALYGALAQANARTPWEIGGKPRQVAFRPVLPGQPACERP